MSSTRVISTTQKLDAFVLLLLYSLYFSFSKNCRSYCLHKPPDSQSANQLLLHTDVKSKELFLLILLRLYDDATSFDNLMLSLIAAVNPAFPSKL